MAINPSKARNPAGRQKDLETMSASKTNLEGGQSEPRKNDTYLFYVNGVAYEAESKKLTGAEIKAMVPDWDPSHDLALEGEGDEPDRIVADDEAVNLAPKKGRRFSSVPKANFG